LGSGKSKQLSESIVEKGLLQQIVPEEEGDFYRVVAGHLRFDACKLLGWQTIQASVVNPYESSLEEGVKSYLK
jgi:ParB-like chromosome segregation protein Spo0J